MLYDKGVHLSTSSWSNSPDHATESDSGFGLLVVCVVASLKKCLDLSYCLSETVWEKIPEFPDVTL